ncbi:transposase [Fluviispira sanaruensis]|uniref:Transposase n=1 Tax=Fluviispira sanaruensis TaxID=2493639 RepID=A0A4P2VP45_FLUSA|nr:transposase [Fluviispira sanaruensis]BBH53984.1 hypothetical protein JCM31447_24380 [Fluviispira sanaruensis]
MDKLAEPRRRFGYQEKRAILEEHFNLGLSLSVLSRKQQIHPVTLYSWKRSLSITESTMKSKDKEWLSARGSIYRDKSVQNIARSLGLKPCYAAPYSPFLAMEWLKHF